MERILETEGMEARALTWSQLGYEVGLECSGRTTKGPLRGERNLISLIQAKRFIISGL